MSIDIFSSLNKWRFAFLLGFILIGFQALTTASIILATPPNHTWLGAANINSSDAAVYIGYLNQSLNTFTLQNLYNLQPQSPRFDLFWSSAGLLIRTGLSAITVYEILRLLCAMFLAFAVFATARAVTSNERSARISSLLMISGLSTGWLYPVWMAFFGHWTSNSPSPADLATEFAIAPILLASAHMILSVALQLLAVRWIWDTLWNKNKKKFGYAFLALFLQTGIHPYFIPFYGILSLIILLGLKLKTRLSWSVVRTWVILMASMLPSATYYLWITLHDTSFRNHYFQDNQLPLNKPIYWIVMLLPFISIISWTFCRQSPELNKWYIKTPWALSWLAAAIFCMLLPFPWTRKYTQGLLPVLVIITLPLWLNLYEHLRRIVTFPLTRALLVLAIFFTYLNLFMTQQYLQSNPKWTKYFYAPNSLMNAWAYIKNHNSGEPIIASDINVNLWTPAFSGKKVWIGHGHETPDFKNKLQHYNRWITTGNPEIFNDFLNQNHIITLLCSNEEHSKICASNLGQDWKKSFEQRGVTVWQRQR